MIYAVYRHWGNEVCSGDDLLFVTANKRLAEDTVALAMLEQEEARTIPFPEWEGTKLYVDYRNEVTEYHAKVKSILTVDPKGHDDAYSYFFEEVEVR
jgi:hypothetical protein